MGPLSVEVCVVKRASILMFTLTEQQLIYRKVNPFHYLFI